jgi:hypothetical protein
MLHFVRVALVRFVRMVMAVVLIRFVHVVLMLMFMAMPMPMRIFMIACFF